MALINHRTIHLDVSDIVKELRRLNTNLEQIFQVGAPEIVPYRDFDPDQFSEVTYSDEIEELVDEHLGRRIGGVLVDG